MVAAGGHHPVIATEPQFNLCPPVTALFMGWQKILEKLDAYFRLRASGVHYRREFLLYSMGGSGKSQIVLRFAELFEQR
jgi:hypothetical protein